MKTNTMVDRIKAMAAEWSPCGCANPVGGEPSYWWCQAPNWKGDRNRHVWKCCHTDAVKRWDVGREVGR